MNGKNIFILIIVFVAAVIASGAISYCAARQNARVDAATEGIESRKGSLNAELEGSQRATAEGLTRERERLERERTRVEASNRDLQSIGLIDGRLNQIDEALSKELSDLDDYLRSLRCPSCGASYWSGD